LRLTARSSLALWRLIQVSHSLVTLASLPVTVLLGFLALMAESGHRPQPWLLPFFAWGVGELVWTAIALFRSRGPEPSDGRLLTIGWLLTVVGAPGVWVVIGLVGGRDWHVVWPYALVTTGCQITRLALRRLKAGQEA
jgi:hypothetical protein